MIVGAVTLSLAMVLIILAQILGVRVYLDWLRAERHTTEVLSDFPRAAVVVSLRGADPFLGECLDRLAAQDYPDFEMHVVVDHPTDPALAVVEDWVRTNSQQALRVSFLEEPQENAYLKTSAIRQSVLALDESIEVVVLVDADALVYRCWLRDMVSPMLQVDVGAVTGNRWYDPNVVGWGSLVRTIYNAASIVSMYLMRATWGGSLGMRRAVFGTEYFAQRMLESFSEEPAIQDATRHAGLKLEIQPNVMILNREQCTLANGFAFARRQLAWTRLYHRDWSKVVAGTVAVYLVFALAFLGFFGAVFWGQWLSAALMGGGLLVALVVSQWSLTALHRGISRRVQSVQDQPFEPIRFSTQLRLCAGLPLALVLLSWAVISASLCRKIAWRGIDYEIVPPNSLRMIRYQPYADVLSAEQQGVSLT